MTINSIAPWPAVSLPGVSGPATENDWRAAIDTRKLLLFAPLLLLLTLDSLDSLDFRSSLLNYHRPLRFMMVSHVTASLLFGATMQHFPEIQLTSVEARVLGCLLEKEILTPGSYPLTHNSLLIACNQSSSRDPITHFTGEEVSEALRGLSEKYLVEKTLGGRAPKFEHCLQDVLSMQPGERAVLTVLLLRGPQSAGEVRQRTDRLHPFSSLDEVEETLTWFIEYPHGPLVRRIPVGEGRRVETFAHLLSPAAADTTSVTGALLENEWRAAIEARLASLESEIAELKAGRMP